jgi:hypothetical protein
MELSGVSNRRMAATVSLLLVTLLMVALLAAKPAQAHVTKDVGPYHFLVGWGAEPAYAGQLNSVQLVLTYRSSGKPVMNLSSGFQATVIYGTQRLPLPLEPTFDPDTGFGTPGDYRAWLIPTAPGDYTFRFTGKIGTQSIDQSFTSGPTTFGTVEDPASVEFPVRAPSNADLSQRLDAQVSRLATSSQLSTTRDLAIVAIVIGGLALAAAAVAIVRRRT